MLPLPHTAGCLVCGPHNPHGLHLDLTFDPATGAVRTAFTPTEFHIGFTGVVHGGVLATVFDEAMVWAATYPAARFCYCAELSVRFRKPAGIGIEGKLLVEAHVQMARSKLITTVAIMKSAGSLDVIAEAHGKYIPMSAEQDREMKKTLLVDECSAVTLAHLQSR